MLSRDQRVDELAQKLDTDVSGNAVRWFFEKLPTNVDGLAMARDVFLTVKSHEGVAAASLRWLCENYSAIRGAGTPEDVLGSSDHQIIETTRQLVTERGDQGSLQVQDGLFHCLSRFTPMSVAGLIDLVEQWFTKPQLAVFALSVLGRGAPHVPATFLLPVLQSLMTPMPIAEVIQEHGRHATPYLRPTGERYVQHSHHLLDKAFIEPILARGNLDELRDLTQTLFEALRLCALAEKDWREEMSPSASYLSRYPPEDDSVMWWNTLEGEDAERAVAYGDYPLIIVVWCVTVLQKMHGVDPEAFYDKVIGLLRGEWLHQWRIALHMLCDRTSERLDILTDSLKCAVGLSWKMIWSGVRHELWNLLNSRGTEMTAEQLNVVLTSLELSVTHRLDEKAVAEDARETELRQHADYAMWLFLHPLEDALGDKGLEDWVQRLSYLNARGFRLENGDTLAGGVHSGSWLTDLQDIKRPRLELMYDEFGIEEVVLYLAQHPRRQDPHNWRNCFNNSSVVRSFVSSTPGRVGELARSPRIAEWDSEYITAIGWGLLDMTREWRGREQAPEAEVGSVLQGLAELINLAASLNYNARETDFEEAKISEQCVQDGLYHACADVSRALAENIDSPEEALELISTIIPLVANAEKDLPKHRQHGREETDWASAPRNSVAGQAGWAVLYLAERAFITVHAASLKGAGLSRLKRKLSEQFKSILDSATRGDRNLNIVALLGYHSSLIAELLAKMDGELLVQFRKFLAEITGEPTTQHARAFITCMVFHGGVSTICWNEFKHLLRVAVEHPTTELDRRKYMEALGARTSVLMQQKDVYPDSWQLAADLIELAEVAPLPIGIGKSTNAQEFKRALAWGFLPRRQDNIVDVWRETVIPSFYSLFKWRPKDSTLCSGILQALVQMPRELPLTEAAGLAIATMPVLEPPLDSNTVWDIVRMLTERSEASSNDLQPAIQIAVAVTDLVWQLREGHGGGPGEYWLNDLVKLVKLAESDVRAEVHSERERLVVNLERLGITAC